MLEFVVFVLVFSIKMFKFFLKLYFQLFQVIWKYCKELIYLKHAVFSSNINMCIKLVCLCFHTSTFLHPHSQKNTRF